MSGCAISVDSFDEFDARRMDSRATRRIVGGCSIDVAGSLFFRGLAHNQQAEHELFSNFWPL